MLFILIMGLGCWVYFSQPKSKSVYEAKADFILNNDTSTLITKLNSSQNLYEGVFSQDARLTELINIIEQLNSFETDLLSLSINHKSTSNKIDKINKSYKILEQERKNLIKTCSIYITSMQGNTAVDGSWERELYNSLFNKTATYITNYCSAFEQSATYIFNTINTSCELKHQLYRVCIYSIKHSINSIVSSQIVDNFALEFIANNIQLDNGNIQINSSLVGGQFSEEALQFIQAISKCDIAQFVANLKTNYFLIINPSSETNNEKLATFYIKKILEV